MFKISNETKVGALTAIAITMLILGVNFLKGRNITKKSRYLYARFQNADGLLVANPVMMNGLNIGTVYKTEPGDIDLNSVLVTIRLDEMVNIPKSSFGEVKTSILGSSSLVITKGPGAEHLGTNDTLDTRVSAGLFGGISTKLEPTQAKLENALVSMDSLLKSVNKTLNDKAQADLQQTLANLALITQDLTKTTTALNGLLSPTGNISKTAESLASFSASLDVVKTKLPAITQNLETTSKNLSQLDLDKTLKTVNETITSLKAVVAKANSNEGTVGMLLNDKKMYGNITSTINSLNLLLQDIRLNPKRYVNVSVFGKKNKSEPLMKPMAEDSITQEQRKD